MDKRIGKIVALAALAASVTAAVLAVVRFRYEILDFIYCIKERAHNCCIGAECADDTDDFEDFADVDEEEHTEA